VVEQHLIQVHKVKKHPTPTKIRSKTHQTQTKGLESNPSKVAIARVSLAYLTLLLSEELSLSSLKLVILYIIYVQ